MTPLHPFQEHLVVLMRGLREFILKQEKNALAQGISSLKVALDFDGMAINQIQLALYLFHDAVGCHYSLIPCEQIIFQHNLSA